MHEIGRHFFFFNSPFKIIYLFIFGCTVSSLLSGLFSSCHEWQLFFQLWCMGFSVKWFLLLWNVGSKAYGLQQLLILGSRTQAQQSPRMGLVKNLPAMLGSISGWRRSPWRRKWQPAPVFLLGESHRQRSLVDYSP